MSAPNGLALPRDVRNAHNARAARTTNGIAISGAAHGTPVRAGSENSMVSVAKKTISASSP